MLLKLKEFEHKHLLKKKISLLYVFNKLYSILRLRISQETFKDMLKLLLNLDKRNNF